MRTAFIEALCEVAAADSRIFLVCGDLGYSVLERFATRFPDRFLNAGVAEQNMTGVAAGLALTGHTVFVYSIVNFPVMRCLEQVRNDVAYHGLNVKIVTVGGGMVYGGHGYTHHGAEDLAVMRVLPNMKVVAPGDPVEAAWATRRAASLPGPVYLRLARGGEPRVHSAEAAHWSVGEPIEIRTGNDVTLASTGGMLSATLAAADILAGLGHSAAVFSVPFLAPLNAQPLFASAELTGRLLTIEDHGSGGFGSLLAELLATQRQRFAFRPLGLGSTPLTVSGTNDQLLARHGLAPADIAAAALSLQPYD